MRLINAQTYRLDEFFNEQVPPYAILSHIWGNDQDEVSFHDITEGNTKGARANHWPIKLEGCCKQAVKDGLNYVWIDTCCIDKTNSVELGKAGLKLIEVEPQECWSEEESLIAINSNPSGNTVQQYWIRFRPEDEASTDFLVLLEPEMPGSQVQPQYHIMTISKTTSLKDLLLYSSNMRPAAFGKKIARDNSQSIQVTMEQDTTGRQGIFNIRLTETATLPTVTVDGTFELELQAAKLELDDVAKAEDNLYLELETFNRQRGTAYTLEFIGRRLTEIKEEQDQLEEIQKWQVELSKQGLSIKKKIDNLKTTALAKGYNPVLTNKISTSDGKLITRSTLAGHFGYVWSVAFSPDGNVLASGSSDNIVRLWEVATGL